MSREPLMLSDTAMVLLRQYIDFNDHREAVRDILLPYSSGASEEAKYNWMVWLDDNPSRTQLESELLQEIWLLWCYPDLKPIRYLDWHLTLEGDFIMWAENSRILEQNNGVDEGYRGHWDMRFPLTTFFIRLCEIYREALAIRAQTKTTP